MASTASPQSEWVSSYADKTDQWVQARLEHLQHQELHTKGSVPRRREIRALRVELIERNKRAEGQDTTDSAQVPAGVLASPAATVQVSPAARPAR